MKILNKWLEENQEVDALDINLNVGIELFDRVFAEIGKEQLPVAGYYLEQLSNLLSEHTEEWWADWDRRSSGKELEIEADFFDCYLRQSVGFDADAFIEPLPTWKRSYARASKPIEIPSAPLETIIDLSHAEDVPGWSQQIESYLKSRGNSCTMAELIHGLPLTPGAIIYTLLLGNFLLLRRGEDTEGFTRQALDLKSSEPDNFYSCDGIEVRSCQHQ